jgi:hypothetical protein
VVPPDQDSPLEPLDEELAERGRLLIAAAVAQTSAPLGLRERIEADRARAGRSSGSGARRGLGRYLLPAGGLVAAAAVAVALLVSGGAAAGPSVLATASLATRGAILPAPEENEANGHTLKASVEGVPFPYWGDAFQWEAVGARSDTIKDRPTKTVYYENPKGVRAAYTIVGGDKIDPPSGAMKKIHNGVNLWITQDGGRRVVTWTRNGHTCVLSAPLSVPQDKLLRLASWKGQGDVTFK